MSGPSLTLSVKIANGQHSCAATGPTPDAATNTGWPRTCGCDRHRLLGRAGRTAGRRERSDGPLRCQRVRAPVREVLEVGRVRNVDQVAAVGPSGIDVFLPGLVEEEREHDPRPVG